MLPDDEVPLDGFRLLNTDTAVVLPAFTVIRVLVHSVDVIHS